MAEDGVALDTNVLTDFCNYAPMIAMNKDNSPVVNDRPGTSHEISVDQQQQQQHFQQQQFQQQQLQRFQQSKQQQKQLLLSDLIDSLPIWKASVVGVAAPSAPVPATVPASTSAQVPASGAAPVTASSPESSNTDSSYALAVAPPNLRNSLENSHASDLFGAEASPATGSPASIVAGTCGWCEINAAARCIECNDVICSECMLRHRRSPMLAHHNIVPISRISSPYAFNTYCDTHKECFRFVCEHCRKVICQYCALHEHRDHKHITIQQYVEEAFKYIETGLNHCTAGTKYVKGSIDKCLRFSRACEREATEIIQSIRKTFRHIVHVVEERERSLIAQVDKLRHRKINQLSDQTAGLRSTLAGLAQNSEMLLKALDSIKRIDAIELAQIITKSQIQLDQLSHIAIKLHPKQEYYGYIMPSNALLNDIQMQGEIFVGKGAPPDGFLHVMPSDYRFAPIDQAAALPPGGVVMPYDNGHNAGMAPVPQGCPNRRPPPASTLPSDARLGRSIPGTTLHVVVEKALIPTRTFGTDGENEGEVSRPWGVCVDRDGNILIADRRNNRVQIFYPDGTFKFSFGEKGIGNGQFDLPAGICVDWEGRIIVVDKDNHRVQVFSSEGKYMLKFGCFGREYGQFQYPWDVAVNARGHIIVTDSRNHRIQQFDSEGRFIKHLVFDSLNHCKGPASPRGVCFTPHGEIIVSDFDNHCLLLIDGDLNGVISARGQEGSEIMEFNRPSGLCCDDDGNIIVADSKNQRVLVFSETLAHLWTIEIRPSMNPHIPSTLDEKDRPCDVALLRNGHIVLMIELSPDARDTTSPHKRFVQVY